MPNTDELRALAEAAGNTIPAFADNPGFVEAALNLADWADETLYGNTSPERVEHGLRTALAAFHAAAK